MTVDCTVNRTFLTEEAQEPSRRKMRKGGFTLADRMATRSSLSTVQTETQSRGPDDKASRANLARMIGILAERPEDTVTPGMLRKMHPRAAKRSMFQSCLNNPHGYGWPRPESAETCAGGSSQLDSRCTSPAVFSQFDSRCTSPAVEEVQMNLAIDATRFEKKYKCPAEVDHLSLYRGSLSSLPGSRSASPMQLIGDSDTPQLPWPPDWRPQTPQLNYDEDVVLAVEQPRPPTNVDNRGSYHLEQQAPNIQAPYTNAALDLEPSNNSEQCPRFNVSTLRRWFNIVSLGTDFVRRRQLVFALNENEDIFCVFCGAELHKHIRSVEKQEGKRGVGNRWKLTEATFELRIRMMRRGLEILDRIDWEWKHGETKGRRLLSCGSLSRKLAFEVFLTYFKYMDMLLEYNDTPNLNWDWNVFGSKDSAKGMNPEEFTRIAMEALGSPKPPLDDGLDEDVIKDVNDVTRAFSTFRRRGSAQAAVARQTTQTSVTRQTTQTSVTRQASRA